MATEKQQRREATRQLKLKLKLEKQLGSKMRGFFSRQNGLVRDVFDETGLTMNANLLQPDLELILKEHYRKTAEKFYPLVVNDINLQLEDAGEKPVEESDPQLLAALAFFISTNVNQSSAKITETSNNEIIGAIADHDDIDGAYSQLQKRNKPRATTIAATETQKASEGSKQMASDEMAQAVGTATGGRVVLRTFKSWLTRMDKKVRSAHDAALFQRVLADVPYLVGGELLMFPGDIELGASPWNTVNCRCVSLFETSIV